MEPKYITSQGIFLITLNMDMRRQILLYEMFRLIGIYLYQLSIFGYLSLISCIPNRIYTRYEYALLSFWPIFFLSWLLSVKHLNKFSIIWMMIFFQSFLWSLI